MFFSHFVLTKKGPYARIWLAAHWDQKLTKTHVFETNIERSIEDILQPKVKMALRTSGHLLLGIVRIYSRKTKYLLSDCNEAFIKIKIAFRPGVIDLPEGNREAAISTITIPEVFHDFGFAMPEVTYDMNQVSLMNQSRAEDITLKEYNGPGLMDDDGFGDMGFDDPEIARDATNIEEGFDQDNLLFPDPPTKENVSETVQNENTSDTKAVENNSSVLEASLINNAFNGPLEDAILDNESTAFLEPSGLGLFDDAPLGDVALNMSDQAVQRLDTAIRNPDESDDDMYDDGAGSVGLPSPPSSPMQVQASNDPELPQADASSVPNEPGPSVVTRNASKSKEKVPKKLLAEVHRNNKGTIALAPLDVASSIQGSERTAKVRRKRKLIVDEVKSISGEEMKTQLSDTANIVTSLDLAPPTKRLMNWKETGGVEKLFALPGRHFLSKTLNRLHQRHLTTYFTDDLDVDTEQPNDNCNTKCQTEKEELLQGNSGVPEQLVDFEQSITPVSLQQGNENPSDLPITSETGHPSQLVETPIIVNNVPVLETSVDTENSVANPHNLPADGKVDDINHPTEKSNLPGIEPLTEHPSLPRNGHDNPAAAASVSESALISEIPELGNIQSSHSTVIVENQQSASTAVNDKISGAGVVSDTDTQFIPPDSPFTSLLKRKSDPNEPHDIPNKVMKLDGNLESSVEHSSDDMSSKNKLHEMQQSDDDDDDYSAPASVGPVVQEEQMEDETYEQFEERVLTKRTTHMLYLIHRQLENNQTVKFSSLTKHNKRKQVAQKFYIFLVLKKQQAVELQQSDSYGEMLITKGPMFNGVYYAN